VDGGVRVQNETEDLVADGVTSDLGAGESRLLGSRSLDSTQQAPVMFLSPFSITAFKIFPEVNLTAAVA
jgi:hypothetical protein